MDSVRPAQIAIRTSKWLNFFEKICWSIYLFFIVILSFLTSEYYEAHWLTLSFGLYLFCTVYFSLIVIGVKHNYLALSSSKYILLFMCLTLLWIVFQAESNFLNPVVGFFKGRAEGLSNDIQVVGWLDFNKIDTFNQEKTRWFALQKLLMLIFFIVSLCIIRTRFRIKQLLITLLLIGICHASIGVLAKFSQQLLVDRAQLDGHFDAARGWFVNRNHFAADISLLMFGGIGLLLKYFYQQKKSSSVLVRIIDALWSPQSLIFCFMAVSFFALALSRSRAGFFGIALSCISLLALFTVLDKRLYINGKWLGILCVFILLVLGLNGDDLLSRLMTNSFSLGERTSQWSLTLEIIYERLLFGYGVGSYEAVFQFFRDGNSFRQVVFDQAHNEFLHIFLEQGLVGLVLWVSIIVLFCYRVVRAYFHTNSTLIKSVSIAAMIVFCATILQSFVDFHLQLPIIHFHLLLIMACAISVATVSH